MFKKSLTAYLLILVFLVFSIPANAQDKSGEEINWQVISSGGSNNGVSTSYNLSGTLGQTAVSTGTSTTYTLSHGFWQDFVTGGGPGCCDSPGDANNNGSINILDATFLINYLYKSGAAPDCNDEADANGNNAINILDVTYLINYLYKSGSVPICGTTGT